MLFNSHEFIFLFFPGVIITYWVLGFFKSNSLNILLLLTASLLFYGLWKWEFLAVLGVSISINYALGGLLIKHKNKSLVVASVFANLLCLFYYKYLNFFKSLAGVQNINEVILPLGISFFTFTQISYLVDCYKGKVQTNRILDYALFVTYFPHLIAGPVLHHKSMISQFREASILRLNLPNLSMGLTIFTLGLFKKVMLADNIMPFVSPVFESPHALTPIDAWGGALAYTLQLYFDFSGYSDMAVGISKMFNIDLPLNFNSPYKATSLINFWNRWHISLSSFLKDYLYIPLGGGKRGYVRKYINIFIVMCLSGIWHGAGETFFIWGALHGLFLLINHGFRDLTQTYIPHIKVPFFIKRGLGWGITMIAVIFGWVFFRAPSIDSAFSITKAMLTFTPYQDFLAGQIVPIEGWYSILGLACIALLFPNTQEFMGFMDPRREKLHVASREELLAHEEVVYAT